MRAILFLFRDLSVIQSTEGAEAVFQDNYGEHLGQIQSNLDNLVIMKGLLETGRLDHRLGADKKEVESRLRDVIWTYEDTLKRYENIKALFLSIGETLAAVKTFYGITLERKSERKD